MFYAKKIFCVAFVLCVFEVAFADYNSFGIPDSAEIRHTLSHSWFSSDLDYVRAHPAEIQKNSVGEEFQIRLEESDGTFAVIVAPLMLLEMEFHTENGIETCTTPVYPHDARGSVILFRSSQNGKPKAIRFYFAADSDVYVQFSPQKNKTLADFIICGQYAARSVPVGIKFESLYDSSLEEIVSKTKKNLPWHYANVNGEDYKIALLMVAQIRKNLDRIIYTADAAYDENFLPVKISDGKPRIIPQEEKSENKISLSGAGFLKWIIDGLVEPIAGGGVYMAPLTQRTVNFNSQGFKGVRSENEDFTFSLDWVRNLALAWFSAQKYETYFYGEAGLNVNIEPFSAEITKNGIEKSVGYLKNSGYKVSALRAILYVLASQEKYLFYLGAVKSPISNKNAAPFSAFTDCAVFFPYFTNEGRFDCIVFQNGKELSLKNFIEENNENFIHLSRALTSDRFFLQ